MQIDTDLSPVVSPNSNISNSFASQRDVLLFGLNSNRTNRHLSDNQTFDLQNLRGDSATNKTGTEVNFPTPNNQNNTITTTNESYSMEKYTYIESMNRDPIYGNTSNGLIIPEHSTDRELNHEDESNKSQIQNMHILEYEEFITDGEPKLSTRSKGSDSLVSGKESDRADKDQQETKRKQQAQYFSENLLQMVEPSDRPIEHNNFVTVVPQAEEITFRRPGMKKKLELQINDEDNASSSTIVNKNYQQEETKKEHVADVSKPNPFFLKGFHLVQESKQEKEAPSFGIGNKSIEAIADHQKKDEENELLAKENLELKQEIKRIMKDLKDVNMENLKLREEVNNKRDIILKEQEKFQHIQNVGKNAKTRDDETIAHLEEENRLLREKERRYKETLRDKDDMNEYLQQQCEELSQAANHQQLYEALAEKVRGFEDNAIQLTKQVEDQREELKAKDNTIENLLLRMDNLTQTVTSKNNEMILLKAEISSLKDELLAVVKSGNEPRPEAKSVGSLYSRIREKDKSTSSPEKKEEVSEQRSFTPVTSNYTHSERKEARPLSSTQKSEVNLHKNYFQAYATRSEKSPDDQASRSGHWSTMKWNILNSKTKDQESQGKEQHKKANNKSIDLHTKSKPDAKKTSQNIEDLQKRLAYLKHKRLEFEKQKTSVSSSKESSSVQTVRKSSIPETSPIPIFKTSLKTQDVVSPVRNIPVGTFHEPTSDLSSENRRKEQSSRASPMFESSSRSSLVYKSIQVNQEPNINEELRTLRTSLTTKPKFQPKIDNFMTNNPGHQTNDDFKVVPRYNSFANIPTGQQASKSVEAKGNKNVKRHSDLNPYSRASEIRSITEAALNKHREYLS